MDGAAKAWYCRFFQGVAESDIMKEIYTDDTYWQKNQTFHEEDAQFKAERCAVALRAAKIAQPGRVLDVGCGGGAFLNRLSDLLAGEEFLGIDVSDTPVAHASNSHRKANVRYAKMDVGDVRERFDLVTANDVFEHVDDYLGFLRQLRKLGRTFYFNIPLDMTAWDVARHGYMHSRRSVGHLHYFSKRSALATLEYAGFEVVHSQYNHSVLHALKAHPTLRGYVAAAPRLITFKMFPDMSVHFLGGAGLGVVCMASTA